MQIITLFKVNFNRLIKKTLYGPNKIPAWHPLHGLKYYSWGTYKRILILSDKTVLTVIICRFYCPAQKKTYSLLPFFISPYQRHVNPIIERCIFEHLLYNKSCESLSEAPNPEPRTIRRWVKKFVLGIDNQIKELEIYLAKKSPHYQVASRDLNTIRDKIQYQFHQLEFLKELHHYPEGISIISYLNYLYGIATASI